MTSLLISTLESACSISAGWRLTSKTCLDTVLTLCLGPVYGIATPECSLTPFCYESGLLRCCTPPPLRSLHRFSFPMDAVTGFTVRVTYGLERRIP